MNAGLYSQATRFATGAALLAVCESCQHTVLRAVLGDRPDARADVVAERALGRLLAPAAGRTAADRAERLATAGGEAP